MEGSILKILYQSFLGRLVLGIQCPQMEDPHVDQMIMYEYN